MGSGLVERRAHAEPGLLHHMEINLGRADVAVSHQFLDGTDVGPTLEQVRGERMSEYMRSSISGQALVFNIT